MNTVTLTLSTNEAETLQRILKDLYEKTCDQFCYPYGVLDVVTMLYQVRIALDLPTDDIC